MADLTTKLGFLELENPIIVSSGYTTDTESSIAKADKYGPGAIILKTSLPNDEYRQVVEPYAPHRYPSLRNRFHSWNGVFVFADAMSTKSLELWADWLNKNKRKFHTPIIASVQAISVEGRVRGAKMMEEAGAAGIELMLRCPVPYFEGFRYSVVSDPQIVEEICIAVKKAVNVPVGVKTSGSPPLFARAAQKAGADWINILGGQLLAAPGINLDTLELLSPYVFTIGGMPSRIYSLLNALRGLRDMSQTTHISASGNIETWQDIAEVILYGASSIQAQSIFMKKGHGVIVDMKQGLVDYMDKKGFATLSEMKGAILPKTYDYNEMLALYARTKGEIVARVKQDSCNGCGLCEEVCAYDAIKLDNNIAKVVRDLCEGCGLCVMDCPTDAIALENLDLLKKMTKVQH